MQTDPIIAVADVEKSSSWYQSIFDCESMHGGSEFDILVSGDKEVLLCLHKWGEHEHPTMANPEITPGNGLILYFRSKNLDQIWQNVVRIEHPIEREMQLNHNSQKREFSIRDLDGYYLTITEYHQYEG